MNKKEIEEFINGTDESKDIDGFYNKYKNRILIRGVIITGFILACYLLIELLKGHISKIVPDFFPLVKNLSLVFIVLSIVYLLALYFNYLKYGVDKDFSIKKEKLNKLHKGYGIYDIVSYIFVCFYVIYLFVSFCFTPASVSGPSMSPTLASGDRLIVNQLYKELNVGDIVVFDPEDYRTIEKENAYIKRILGKPNDVISFKNGKIYINDELEETILISDYSSFRDLMSYENNCILEGNEYEGVIPKDLYILIGDNYGNSLDSSELGLIHKDDIIGKAIFRFWPFSSIGKI